MLYFYYGDNIYSLEEKLKLFRQRYLKRFPSGVNLWKLDLAEGLEKISDIVETHSMFDEKKLVFAGGATELKKEDWEKVEGVIKKNSLKKSDDVVVVFYEKRGTEDIDKRKKAFTYLKKEAKTEEFKTPTGDRLLSWIKGEVKKQDGEIYDDAVRELSSRVGPNTLQLVHEIEKLILYKKGEVIERADVEKLVTRTINPNVFETLDSLAKRDVPAAIRSLHDHIRKGDDPIQLLGMFAYEVRTLLLVKEASAKSNNPMAIAKELKLHPFAARKTLGFVGNFSMEELFKMHSRLAEADVAIKTGKKEPELALEDFIYSFL